MVPITNFVAGVQENNPNKLVVEKKSGLDQITKLTTFENRKPIESLIKHSKIAPQKAKPKEEIKNEDKKDEKKDDDKKSDKKDNEEEDIDIEDMPQPDLEKIQSVVKKDPNLPEIGTYIYLTNMKIYGFVKSKIE